MVTPYRKDPEQLLEELAREESRRARGKLRIYFGASAGVGKTFSMLTAAHQELAAGHDVVIGVIETHDREDTRQLVLSVPAIPLATIHYRERDIRELDLDAMLARAPQIALIDELAHTNAPGLRHSKRWQDIDELLGAGIDVWTTLNVQHLESLNDIISGITGIRVTETVPDQVFDDADEVILVDITTEALLARLQAGKVYMSEQVPLARQHFFRKGNLIALREIALRRTAERIHKDVRQYRHETYVEAIWRTAEGILVVVDTTLTPNAAQALIRHGSRLSGQMSCPMHVMFLREAANSRAPARSNGDWQLLLQQAEQLQATTTEHYCNGDVMPDIAAYCRSQNLSRLLLDRSVLRRYWWRPSPLVRVRQLGPDIDIIIYGGVSNRQRQAAARAQDRAFARREPVDWGKVGLALMFACTTTALLWPFSSTLAITNIAMLYLALTMVVALRLGRWPGLVCAVSSVALFDFSFIPPLWSFSVADIQYLITLLVMLAVTTLISQLAAQQRFQGRLALQQTQRVHSLFELAKRLSGSLQKEQIVQESQKLLLSDLGEDVFVILPDAHESLLLPEAGAGHEVAGLDMVAAQWAFDNEEKAGFGADTLAANAFRYFPLHAPVRIRGVLAVRMQGAPHLLSPEWQQQLEIYAHVIAIALERVHFVEVANEFLRQVESEKLRVTMLNVISHDLRTPLTVLIGEAEVLAGESDDNHVRQKAAIILDRARCMHDMMSKLLDMAKIDSGQQHISKSWQSIEELVGGAIRHLDVSARGHVLDIRIAPTLPLVECDPVLIERVIANLVENALRYSQPGTQIDISARHQDDSIQLIVADRGVGLPDAEAERERLFDKFVRAHPESDSTGAGLGLAIARQLVQLHGGTLTAANRAGGGSVFTVQLPALPMPPVLE